MIAADQTSTKLAGATEGEEKSAAAKADAIPARSPANDVPYPRPPRALSLAASHAVSASAAAPSQDGAYVASAAGDAKPAGNLASAGDASSLSSSSRSGGGGGAPGASQDQSAFGKYLLLSVPDWNGGVGPTGSMSTYLRLGAIESAGIVASPGAPPATGEDLASLVTSFIDDDRVREGCPDYLPPAVRQAETAILHTKGGWRDHTDGNRITTTRGDKVEVIKGNYRMVVLGRQDDQAGWDVSGGHIAEGGITFDGAAVIEYTTEDYGGTWVVVEHTRKGHVHTAYHGKVYDYYCGEIVESITGSESPTELQPNPVVTETTWAESITNTTGSMTLPVPIITDATYATAMESTTTADTVTSVTTVSDSITDSTSAGSISSSTSVDGDISDTTTAASITSTTTAAAMTDTTTAALITSTTIGNTISTTVGNSLSTIVGTETEIIVGNTLELTVGGEESISLGLVVELTVALMIDICIAGRISVDLGPRLEISAGNSTEINVGKEHVHISRNGATPEEVQTNSIYSRLSLLSIFV